MKNFFKIAFFSVFVTTFVIIIYALIYKFYISNKSSDTTNHQKNQPEFIENTYETSDNEKTSGFDNIGSVQNACNIDQTD